MTRRFWLGWACSALLLSTSARAQVEAAKSAPPTSTRAVTYAADLGGGLHAGPNWADDPGWSWGLRGLFRYGVLEAGAQLGFSFTSSDEIRGADEGVLLGFGFLFDSGFRVDALSVLGLSMYNSRPDWMNDDPGTSATLLYGGSQLGVSWRFSPPGFGYVTLGLVGLYEANFLRPTVRYEYSRFAPDGTITSEVGEHQFGERRLGLRFVLGMSFDLIPITR